MRNISDGSCRENQNTHFVFSKFFFKSCRLWYTVNKYGRASHATDHNTDSEYVILIALHILCSITLFKKNSAVTVKKYGRASQVTDHNTDSEYATFIPLHSSYFYAKASQCYKYTAYIF